MSFKRILGLSGLLGVLAAAAMAVPAQAAVGLKAVCVVAGNAKVSPSVALIGGKGSFTFDDIALICAGVTKGVVFVEPSTVVAAGGYKNVVCGTGKATGTVTSSTSFFASKIVGKKFAVEFVGAQGQFYWHSGDWAKPVLPTKVLGPILEGQKPSTAKTWALAGYIGLLPPGPPEVGGKPVLPLPDFLGGECTKAFGVIGVVIIDV